MLAIVIKLEIVILIFENEKLNLVKTTESNGLNFSEETPGYHL